MHACVRRATVSAALAVSGALGAGAMLAGCAQAERPASATHAEPAAPAEPLVDVFGGRLQAPPDIEIARYAEVSDARGIAIGPDGAAYVSRPGANTIVRLFDTDGDGVAEQTALALRGLDRPHGMAFRDGWFYVANTGAVLRYALDGGGLPGGAPHTIARYSSGGGHWTRSLVFGADGAVYVSIGSSCNVCEERSPDRAAVMRFDPDGAGGRVFASGLRNAVGMAVHPGTGRIWVVQNERDNLRPDHENLPVEEINILDDGAHYGWPYCHGDRVPNPEYGDAARCASTVPPALGLQAHTAPLGIAFLDQATALPEAYRHDALVTLHGSWNRDEPVGASVVRVRIDGGRPVSYEHFIVGWQLPNGSRWGRPVDVVVARDGSVLITDDQGDAVWRVRGR